LLQCLPFWRYSAKSASRIGLGANASRSYVWSPASEFILAGATRLEGNDGARRHHDCDICVNFTQDLRQTDARAMTSLIF